MRHDSLYEAPVVVVGDSFGVGLGIIALPDLGPRLFLAEPGTAPRSWT